MLLKINNSGQNQEKRKICLLGASFETGNMGVSALAESSIKIMLSCWPDAEIILLGSGHQPQQLRLSVSDKETCVKTLPIRFCKNIFLPYHFLWFVFYGLVVRVLPTLRLKNAVANRNPYFKMLYETDLVTDITGGDSFSNIYGFRRFFLGFLHKWLVIFLRKELVLLPQTYGPFKGNVGKAMARYILRRASTIYSRGQADIEYVNKLLSKGTRNGKVKFAPDVAFVLDARKPERVSIEPSADIRAHSSIVVGLNISGWLFSGGCDRDSMLGLKVNYHSLVYEIIDLLMKNENVAVIVIPHVFPPANNEGENDPQACSKVYEELKGKYSGRIFLTRGCYNHNEVKYIIGLCDFFIGSRMHSCIAALSQGIPAVGIAYSKKFQGMFGSIGLENCVADMRNCSKKRVLEKIEFVFEDRDKIRGYLKQIIPEVKENVMNMFEHSNG